MCHECIHFNNSYLNRYKRSTIVFIVFSQNILTTLTSIVSTLTSIVTTLTSIATKFLSVFSDLFQMNIRNENYDVVLVF